MSKEQVNALAQTIESATNATAEAAAKIPADRRMAQVQEGKSHPTWLLGHMTTVMGNAGMGLCLGMAPTVPPEFAPHFAPDFMGGQPVQSDASVYPAWDDILAAYKKVAADLIAGIRTLDDADIAGAPKGPVPDAMKERFPTLGAGINMLVWHDTYHQGQMNLLAALELEGAKA